MSLQPSPAKSSALPFFLLFALYGSTRFPMLLSLPIFNDEAIYLRWADIIRADPSRLLVSAMDGKTPLFMWLCAVSSLFFDDPLRAGRTVSALAGFLGLLGIFRLGERWFGASVAALAAAIYLVLPFNVTYDRMALADTLADSLAVWTVYYAVRYAEARHSRFRAALLAGLALGLGFLAKTPLLMFGALPVAALWLLGDRCDFKAWLGLLPAYGAALALVSPYLLYDPPARVQGVDKIFHNARPLMTTPLPSVLGQSHFPANCKKLAEAMTAYVSWPILLAAAVAIVFALKTRGRRTLLLLFWLLLPATSFALLLGSEFYARYFLLCIPPLVLLAAKGLMELRERAAALTAPGSRPLRHVMTGAMIAILAPAAIRAIPFVTSPLEAAWTQKDRWQYISSQYSGYGIAAAAQFLARTTDAGPVAVFFSETWGIPGDALHLYLKNVPNLKTYEAWWAYGMPIFPRNLKDIHVYRSKYEKPDKDILEMQSLNGKQVFFVDRGPLGLHPPPVLEQNPNLDLIQSFNRFDGGYAFSIYKLNPERDAWMTPAPSQERSPP